MKVNVVGEQISQKEIDSYIEYGKNKYKGKSISEITIKTDGDFVDLSFEFDSEIPFERIRRITGYLVGNLDRFNNAKRSEENDRVKHNV